MEHIQARDPSGIGPKQDAQAIHRHLESLKSKLDKFLHERGIHAGGGSAG
jgi:hypothetical protein